MPEQLAFDLPVRTSRTRGDFFVSDVNRNAVARLDAPETWPGGKLALTGPKGAGKTHLAHIWSEEHRALLLSPDDLVGADLAGIDTAVAVEIETPLTASAEECLFHLHNHMASSGLPLLIVARAAPARWPLALPDLKSRMAATDVVAIDKPDDALLAAVLLKLFTDRQLKISPNLIDWMVRRIGRSFADAQAAVAKIDTAALAAKKPVTRYLARRILDNPRDRAR
jgi:chromosomal replication initiation ATPase DnaA